MMKQSWIFNNRIELFLYENVAPSRYHDLLKKHLADALEISPSEVELERRNDGKWLLKTGRVSFSTSHSRDRLLIAIDPRGRPLGVDLQFQDDDIDFDLIAKHLYSPNEQQKLKETATNQQKNFATQLWCLKEARFKMCGDSLFTHPDEISIAEDLGSGFHYAACSF